MVSVHITQREHHTAAVLRRWRLASYTTQGIEPALQQGGQITLLLVPYHG